MNSTLTFDPSASAATQKRVWEFGFNTCHGALTMRKDLSAQMAHARNTMGLRHWRCHGLLDDENGVWSRIWHPENPEKERYQVCFSGLRRILDNAIEMGLTPYVELSHMPQMLALYEDAYMFHYRANTSPPKDPAQWGDLIHEVLRHCVKRYGIRRVREWWFEVWNEPNLGPNFDAVEAAPGEEAEKTGSQRPAAFFHGTQEDYLRMYGEAARGIKRIDSDLRVGGPSTARAEWVGDFLEACKQRGMPVDFVGTHHYATDNCFEGTEYENAAREVKIKAPRWAKGIDHVTQVIKGVRNEIDAIYPGLPLIWSEWNLNVGWPWQQRDRANNAAHVMGVCAALEKYADGQLFWNLSDIWEEPDLHFEPFSGQMGMITVDGIPKASARAFELMHHLETGPLAVEGLPENPRHGCLAAASPDGRRVTLALWNEVEHAKPDEPWSLELRPTGLPFSQASLTRIAPGQGSPFEKWQEMGEPANLDDAGLAELRAASELRAETLPLPSGTTLEIPPGTAAFLVLER
ncbi:MAG: GH39 family glycosyl hydrolase [Puniceicoccaceae bacterium]